MVTEARAPSLAQSPVHTEGETLLCGLGMPFQTGPRTAAMVVNLRPRCTPGLDYEGGGDIVLFDDLTSWDRTTTIPLCRNEAFTNPRSGRPCILVKNYPVVGFVPAGSDHPHAGTGFGIAVHMTFPRPGEQTRESLYGEADRYQVFELLQFAFDGNRFRVRATEPFTPDGLAPDFNFLAAGMSSAIPDGDDLLLPVSGHRSNVADGCGVLRFRNRGAGWRAIEFHPVLGHGVPGQPVEIYEAEPSCVRDRDGSLLFTNRRAGWTEQTRPRCHDVLVWRSRDGGSTWEKLFEVPGIRAEAPVSIGQTASGAPYIVGNLNTGPLVMSAAGWAGKDAGTSRELLCLWPLKPDRSGLEPARVICDARAEFGPPPHGTSWRVDHPVGVALRLRDGAMHGVLTYRVLEDGEYTLGAAPTDHTGCYVKEIDL